MLSAVSSLTGDAIQGSRGFLRTDSRLAITGKDYKMKRLLFLIAAALLLAASAYADAPCSDLYEQAKTSIVEARVGRGLEMKLLTKVENAWRIFRSGKKNAQKNALKQLDNALSLLDKNSTKQLPPDLRAALTTRISDLRHCIAGGQLTTGTLTVRVSKPSITTMSGTELGAGAIIRVNDEEVATTGADGTVTIEVPAGSVAVDA